MLKEYHKEVYILANLHFLMLQAYAKFAGVPLQTCVTNNPFWTPNGRLPVFKHGKQILSSFPEIKAYLRRKVIDVFILLCII
jgi:hypothetical protein